MKRDLLGTFAQLLHSLTAEHEFPFNFDELKVPAQSVGGLLKNAVASRAPKTLVDKIDDGQRNRCRRDDCERQLALENISFRDHALSG
jgi:hypothetical protein